MSQAEKSTSPDELARTIKAIRLRLGMNTTAFSKAIGVTQGQVSRYEASHGVPSANILANLLRLADGTEKNPILKRLSRTLALGPLTESEALSEVTARRKRFDAVWAAIESPQPGGAASLPFWANILGIAPNLAKLLDLVSGLYKSKSEVDESLVHIMQLWCEHHDSNPAVRQCFLDAAQYLGLMLEAKNRQAENAGKPGVRKYEGNRKKKA